MLLKKWRTTTIGWQSAIAFNAEITYKLFCKRLPRGNEALNKHIDLTPIT